MNPFAWLLSCLVPPLLPLFLGLSWTRLREAYLGALVLLLLMLLRGWWAVAVAAPLALFASYLAGKGAELGERPFPGEGTSLEGLTSLPIRGKGYWRFRWGAFYGLPWAVGVALFWAGLWAGRGPFVLFGLALALVGRLWVEGLLEGLAGEG